MGVSVEVAVVARRVPSAVRCTWSPGTSLTAAPGVTGAPAPAAVGGEGFGLFEAGAGGDEVEDLYDLGAEGSGVVGGAAEGVLAGDAALQVGQVAIGGMHLFAGYEV